MTIVIGDGTIQRRIADNRCPSCRGQLQTYETYMACNICALTIEFDDGGKKCAESVDNDNGED